VLDDEVWVVPQNTYYFKASGGDWRDFTFFGQIGNHYFYTRSFNTRYNGSSIPNALYARAFKYAQYGCKPSQRVYRIQYMLKSLGYDVEKADKYFGMGTRAALIKFQQDQGLETDGVAGPATMKALIRAFGVDAYCDKFS
ncbi:MAG: peptidoglycan-binding domain-containing protein, partial [Bacillota bacterium]